MMREDHRVISLRVFTEAELEYFDRDKRTDDPYNFFGLRRAGEVRHLHVLRVAQRGRALRDDGERVRRRGRRGFGHDSAVV